MTWHVFDSPLLKILLLTMIKINKMMFCTFIKKKKIVYFDTNYLYFFFFFYFKVVCNYFSIVAYMYMIVAK